MIQNLISGLDVGQQFDEANPVSRAFRECANDKIEIFPGKSCPTVRLNHRFSLHSIIRATLAGSPLSGPALVKSATRNFLLPETNCILMFFARFDDNPFFPGF